MNKSTSNLSIYKMLAALLVVSVGCQTTIALLGEEGLDDGLMVEASSSSVNLLLHVFHTTQNVFAYLFSF